MKIFLSAFLSFLPISELRGGIPFALASGMHPLLAFFVCTLVNLLVAPFVFFFLDKTYYFFFRKSIEENKIIKKIKKKSIEEKIKKYGPIALTFFVAIPFPFTGAWTGSVIAWLLRIEKKKALFFISLGVIIAGILVTLASLGILQILKLI
ncbi:MAG: small multi-drug export protein [Candidatus Pacearchaeota archaeon]|nr:small multi-drug export protein [Candidatus Pacearchaeota archaeon]